MKSLLLHRSSHKYRRKAQLLGGKLAGAGRTLQSDQMPGFRSSRLRTGYCSFAYSALASFRMGMPGSASFQSVRKSL